LPEEIIKRAEVIADKRSRGLPIERLDTELSLENQRRYRSIFEAFQEFNCENGDVAKFLQEVIFKEE